MRNKIGGITIKFKCSVIINILIYFALWVGGFFIGHIFNDIYSCLFKDLNNNMRIGMRRLIISGIQIIVFFLWVKFIEKRPIKCLGFKTKSPIKSYIIGMIIGFSAITITVCILKCLEAVRVEGNGVDSVDGFFVMIIIGWFIQSASEEIAIRGWLIPILKEKSSAIGAIAITSLIFGICHLFSEGVSIVSFVNLILSGVFFSLYSIYTESIVGTCGIHFMWNLALGNIYGFPVSGFSDNGSKILYTISDNRTILTGGAFGAEASIITTGILSIGIIVMYLYFHNCKSK